MSNAEAYITLFFQDLENLNQCQAIYLNTLIPINQKYKASEGKTSIINELDQEDAENLKAITKEIRYATVRLNTKLKALQNAFPDLKQENQKKVDDLYKKIIFEPKPDYEVVEQYVIELNKLFVKGTGNQLLVKSNQYYSALTESNNVSGYDANVEEQQ
jgi:hypothetical protein